MRRDRGRHDPSAPGPGDGGTQEPAHDAVPAVDSRLIVREEGFKGYLGSSSGSCAAASWAPCPSSSP